MMAAKVVAGERQPSRRDWCRSDLDDAVDRIRRVWPLAVDDLQAIGFPHGRRYDGTPGGTGGLTVPAEHGPGYETVPATAVEVAALTGRSIGWVAELHDVVVAVLAAAWPARHFSLVWQPTPVCDLLHEAVERIAVSWQVDDIIDADPRSANYRRDVFGLERLADQAARWWPDRVDRRDAGARQTTVEKCGGCLQPIIGGRLDPVKRIDGDPFHLKNPEGRWCYHASLRSRGRLGHQKPDETSEVAE